MARSRKKRRRGRRGAPAWGKIVAVVLVAAILIGAGVVFVPRLCHRCDNCDSAFVGTGYYANVVTDFITAISGNEDKILCKDCAMQEHALAIAAGKSLKDYKRPLFEKEGEGA